MSKNVVEPERPQMTIWRRVACWISKATRAQAQASACAPTPTRTHSRTRKHTHTHTQIYAILMAFPRQQWFRECACVTAYILLQ